jgi:hypothetical protein
MTRPPRAPAEPDSAMDGNSLPRPRPFGVTLFLWMVLSLSVWGLLRLSAALTWRDVLTQFHASLSPLYLSITGAGWAVVGLLLLWSIWAGKRWAHPAIPISIALWLAEYWIERIFFEASRANLPFTLFLSLILLAATFLISFNRKTKDFLLKKRGP